MRGIRGFRSIVAIAVAACAFLSAPGAASAATVVNGNFETGNLQGWRVYRALEAGNWFAYSGSNDPIADKRGIDPPLPPPQGRYAAVADEINPDTLVLYQDVALPAGGSERLTLTAYYKSSAPIAVPPSGTLSARAEDLEGAANQQYRIDVMKPEAPLESVDPNDVLATVFRTQPRAPTTMQPRQLSADLSPFAGQTVRLRFAVAAHEEVLTAGVDDVSISAAGAGPRGGGGKASFGIGKPRLNRKKGSAVLPVTVPEGGALKARDAGSGGTTASRRKPALLRQVTARTARAKTVLLRLRPTGPALATLRRKHKLRVQVAVTFTPSGGSAATKKVPVVLKLDPPRR